MTMDLLEAELSYKFRDPELLQEALTHTTFQTPTSSPFNIRKRTCDHLKLLGDAVLKLLTSQYAICVSPPNDKVHNIVRIKDNLSNRYCQNLVGRSLQLEKKGIVVTNLPSDQICSHIEIFVKSIFGAIFLDAGGSEKKGFISCWKVFLKLWKPVISSYDGAKPLLACFPEPKYSSQDFLKERFSNFKAVDLNLLEEKIGFKFLKQPHLLEQAMTHDSIDNFTNLVENPDPQSPEFVHFQNLEFLGDSVLELVIMEYLYLRSSSADPLGQMLFFNKDTSQKLVSSRFQIQVANKLKLGRFVIKPPQVGLASYDDFVESLIGSIYIHAKAIGLRVCAKVVLGIWGLEPSLEEESDEKSGQENQQAQLNGTKNEVANKKDNKLMNEAGKSVESQKSASSPATAPIRKAEASKKSGSSDSLQSLLNYNFVNTQLLRYLSAKIDVSTAEARATSMNLVNISKNLQVIGKRAIEFIITEYVIGICHSSINADLSAEMKRSITKLIEDLSGDELQNDIYARFKLSKYFSFEEKKLPNPLTSQSDVLPLIFGAVFVDSTGDLSKAQKLFLRFWGNYTNGARPDPLLTNWFPDTSEKQQIFRTAVNAKVSDVMWKKMDALLGHSFVNRNLLEQALTDEKSQGYAKQQHDAYPLGNPFGLQILGKRAIDLFSAHRCYLNTLAEPENFTGVLQRFDQSLFNTLKSRFAYIERYYANHKRYPFPPKKNPRAPYESMIAALYLDVGGGMKGLQQIHIAISKACPTLLELKKPKAVKEATETAGSVGECSSTTTLVVGGKKNKETGCTTDSCGSESGKLLSNSPVKFCKNVQEGLNTSFGSQEGVVETHLGKGSIPSFFISAPVTEDPLLSELQLKLGYKFVNPLNLKIVLEVDIPVGEDGGGDCGISSKKYFEIFKILGKRALNLLTTELALLESLPVSKNCDISEAGKRQVENRIVHLKSPRVMDMVAKTLELKKYAFTFSSNTNSASSSKNEDFITALIGAVFIDSRANYLKISALFNNLWKSSIDPNRKHVCIVQCFPATTEGQLKLRSATGTFHTDCKWRKLYRKLGYTFKNINILEQALTDEGSQELARNKHNAYPTGNPFALRLLGRCVIELVIAYKSLPTSPKTSAQVDSYFTGLASLEKALFNSFINNFLGTQKYYACVNQKKTQSFPPKVNPFGPYEAIMGAVYVDSAAGNPGLDTVGIVIVQRKIGIKGNKPVNGIVVNPVPIPPSVKLRPSSPQGVVVDKAIPIETVVSASSPVPSTSSALSDSLNTSFSSKCAANFSISPAQIKKSPLKPISSSTPVPATTITAPFVTTSSSQKSPTLVPSSPPKEKESSMLASPQKSSKKQKQQSAVQAKEKESATLVSTQKIPPKESPALVSTLKSPPKESATLVSIPKSPQKESPALVSTVKSPKKQKQQPTAQISPPKSPKKQQNKQQKTYASVLINGEAVQTDNKLIIAVTNAQSQIQALQKKQETKEHYRKLSMEKEKLQLLDQDQASTTSSSRSRCPSTSTITSIGSQPVGVGQKRKRKGSKKQTKKAKAAQAQQQAQAVDSPQQEANSRRISAWCQNQMPSSSSSSSSSPPTAGTSSLCTSEVHQQRSMVHQLQDVKGQQEDPIEKCSQFSSASSSNGSSYNTHVPPVNMVCGYRKSTVDDDGYAAGSGKNCKQDQHKQASTSTTSTSGNESTRPDPPSGGFSYMGVLKWTSVFLGVAFLLARYSQGKK